MKKPNVIVFDFDGTIADSQRATEKLFKLLSKEFGFEQTNSNGFDIYKEKGAQEAIQLLGIPKKKLPAIIEKYRTNMSKLSNTLKPIKGIKNVLTELEKNGFTLGILTSNSEENVNRFLKANKMDFFEFVYSQGELFGKDTIMKQMLTDQNLVAENVIYVGDESRDIESAKKVNIEVIAVTWGYNSSEVLKKYKPNHLVNQPREIIELLI